MYTLINVSIWKIGRNSTPSISIFSLSKYGIVCINLFLLAVIIKLTCWLAERSESKF